MRPSIHPGLKTLFGFTILILIVSAQSCKKSDLKEEALTPDQLEQLKTFVANSTGLPLASVQYDASKKTFIAANDILISLAEAQKRLNGSEISPQSPAGTTQRVYTYTVTPANVANIAIYADNTVPSDWIIALDAAIANWNSTNSHVVMKRVTAITTTVTTIKGKKKTTTTNTVIPSYNILVTTLYNSTTTMVAQAYLPDYSGTAGYQVQINTYYNTINSSYKTFTITHELGHTIGFTHTDATFGNLIPNTPESDPTSVMNSIMLPWNGFTNYDLIAVRTIYPK